MKRLVIFAGASLFASAATLVPAAAQDAFATTDLNMRAGPGSQYPVVAVIPSDVSVAIHGCMETWCDVSSEGYRGWAYAPYLAYDLPGSRVPVPEVGTEVEVPSATFEAEPYWEEHYRDQPFYVERGRFVGNTAAGATSGAVAGAVVGGPVGAAVGGFAGAAIGGAITPPERVRSYVAEQEVEPAFAETEVVVGASVPEPIYLYPIPDYEYRYAVVNRRPVLVEPASRRIVYIYR